MRVDGTDVTQLQGQMGTLVEEAHIHIDHLFNYFTPAGENRTDFSEVHPQMEAASHAGRMLELFVDISKWAMWAGATEAALAEHGKDATIDHVATILKDQLATRALALGMADQLYGPVASLYMRLQCQAIARAIQTCRKLNEADGHIGTIITEVAPTLGMTEDEVRTELKKGNNTIARALADHSFSKVEAAYASQKMTVPDGLRDRLYGLAGLLPEGGAPIALNSDMAQALGSLGLDASNTREISPGVFAAEVSGADFARIMPALASRPGQSGSNIKVG